MAEILPTGLIAARTEAVVTAAAGKRHRLKKIRRMRTRRKSSRRILAATVLICYLTAERGSAVWSPAAVFSFAVRADRAPSAATSAAGQKKRGAAFGRRLCRPKNRRLTTDRIRRRKNHRRAPAPGTAAEAAARTARSAGRFARTATRSGHTRPKMPAGTPRSPSQARPQRAPRG